MSDSPMDSVMFLAQGEHHRIQIPGKSKGKGKRQYYRLEWIPQFPDGSGWDVEDEWCPYFYEHITPQEVEAQIEAAAERLYKIVCFIPSPDQPHKNTHFVKGSYLNEAWP